MRNNLHRGFTLIELLVVMAVIGLMVAIVVAALNSSRAKGANAGIKSNMRTITQQVELIYLNTTPNGYGTVSFPVGTCAQTAGTIFADPTVWRAIQETQTQSGGTMPTCASTTTQWAVSAPLRTTENGKTHWCVETEGKAKGQVGSITGTTCL